MRIAMNGRVSVYPTRLPPRILLHHRLCETEKQIVGLGRQYAATDRLDFGAVNRLYSCTGAVRNDFINALKGTAGLIQPGTSTDAPFFKLFKLFIEGVYENDHTVLPQFKYLQIYFNALDRQLSSGKESQMSPTGGMGGLWRLIGQQSSRAVHNIRSYNCMLSESMDEFTKKFNIARMVREILSVQRKLSIAHFADEFYGNSSAAEVYQKAQDQVKDRVIFTGGFKGAVEGVSSIIYQLLQLLLSNSFKATFLRQGRSLSLIAERSGVLEYSSLRELPPPRVEVSLNEAPGSRVSIKIKDNGIGMTNEMLRQLLSAERPFNAFGTYTISGGKSMQLVPYMMDYVGELHGTSEIGKGTTWEILLPVKQAFN